MEDKEGKNILPPGLFTIKHYGGTNKKRIGGKKFKAARGRGPKALNNFS